MTIKSVKTGNSASLAVGNTSVAKPETPTIGAVAAGATPSTQVTVAYTAATKGAAGTTFTATSTPSSLTGTGASPITVSGLTASTSYTFTVKASNANGDSPLSAASSSITTGVNPTAYESISTVTVGSGGAANIEFTSIPATFTHLQIRGIAKASTGDEDIGLRFNSDTAGNYSTHRIYGDGTSVAIDAVTSVGIINYVGRTAAGTSIFGANVIDVLDYANTNKYKTTRALGGRDNNGGGIVLSMSGSWRNTNAVTTITLIPSGGTFSEYSQFALYGIKGA